MNSEQDLPCFHLTSQQMPHIMEQLPKGYSLVGYRPTQKRAPPSSPLPALRTTRQKKSSFSRFFLDNSGVPRNLSDQMRKCYVLNIKKGIPLKPDAAPAGDSFSAKRGLADLRALGLPLNSKGAHGPIGS